VALGAPPAQAGGTPPVVVETTPQAGEELPLDGTVTLYFDQPVDFASVEAAFSIEPAVEGV
jgi:hypothetical protein